MPEVILGGIPKAPFRVKPSNESLLPLHLRDGSVMILMVMRGYEGQSHSTPSGVAKQGTNHRAKPHRSPLPVGLGWEHHSLELAWGLHSLPPRWSFIIGFSWKTDRKEQQEQDIKKRMLTLSLWENTPTSSTALKISQILSLSFQRISRGQSLGRKCLRGWRKNLYVYVLYLQKWITGAVNLEVWG